MTTPALVTFRGGNPALMLDYIASHPCKVITLEGGPVTYTQSIESKTRDEISSIWQESIREIDRRREGVNCTKRFYLLHVTAYNDERIVAEGFWSILKVYTVTPSASAV